LLGRTFGICVCRSLCYETTKGGRGVRREVDVGAYSVTNALLRLLRAGPASMLIQRNALPSPFEDGGCGHDNKIPSRTIFDCFMD
jgi:hypothetical protein